MATTTTMTLEEFAAIPDDGHRYALVRGVVVRMSPTGLLHLKIVGFLIRILGAYVDERGLGLVGGEGGFIFARDPLTIYGPDVVFISADRLPPEDEWIGYQELAPDLIAEVLSPSNSANSMDEKLAVYLGAGVRLVWVVDPRRRTVAVHRPGREPEVMWEGDDLDGEDVVPGFRLPVAELFR